MWGQECWQNYHDLLMFGNLLATGGMVTATGNGSSHRARGLMLSSSSVEYSSQRRPRALRPVCFRYSLFFGGKTNSSISHWVGYCTYIETLPPTFLHVMGIHSDDERNHVHKQVGDKQCNGLVKASFSIQISFRRI